jgi:hypothetical protein
MLLEELANKALATLDQILHFPLNIVRRIPALMSRLEEPSARTPNTTTMTLATTRTSRTTLDEMLNLGTTSPTLA